MGCSSKKTPAWTKSASSVETTGSSASSMASKYCTLPVSSRWTGGRSAVTTTSSVAAASERTASMRVVSPLWTRTFSTTVSA